MNKQIEVLTTITRLLDEHQIDPRLVQAFSETYNTPFNPHRKPMTTNTGGSERDVVLVSGGLDSTFQWKRAQQTDRKLTALYINFGQSYATPELNMLTKQGVRVVVSDVDMKSVNQWNHILPNRNLYAIMEAGHMANGGDVWVGINQGEVRKYDGDKSLYFFEIIRAWLFAEYGVGILHTLEDVTKADMVMEWHLDGDDVEWLYEHTYSCYSGNDHHCGECMACIRHYIAFAYHGLLPEKTLLKKFDKNPHRDNREIIHEIRTIIRQKQHEYAFPHARFRQTERVLKRSLYWHD